MRVEWKFVESRSDGDVYQVSYAKQQVHGFTVAASDENLPAPVSSAMRIVYAGEPLVIFENEMQVVLIYPGKIEDRSTITDKTPRAPGT